jgi:hypothetical protein
MPYVICVVVLLHVECAVLLMVLLVMCRIVRSYISSRSAEQVLVSNSPHLPTEVLPYSRELLLQIAMLVAMTTLHHSCNAFPFPMRLSRVVMLVGVPMPAAWVRGQQPGMPDVMSSSI